MPPNDAFLGGVAGFCCGSDLPTDYSVVDVRCFDEGRIGSPERELDHRRVFGRGRNAGERNQPVL